MSEAGGTVKIFAVILTFMLASSCQTGRSTDVCVRMYNILPSSGSIKCLDFDLVEARILRQQPSFQCVESKLLVGSIATSSFEIVEPGIIIEDFSGVALCDLTSVFCQNGVGRIILNPYSESFSGQMQAVGKIIDTNSDSMIAAIGEHKSGRRELYFSGLKVDERLVQKADLPIC